MEKKYTIERFDDFIAKRNFNAFTSEKVKDINDFMLLGAIYYYGMVARLSNDYVTRADIDSGVDEEFDQFLEQEAIMQIVEEFADSEGIEEDAVYFAINQRKEEIVKFLSTKVNEIAQNANEGWG
ncbi:hypothetical protein D3C87_573780 [compost metagenome]